MDTAAYVKSVVRSGVCRPVSRCLLPPGVTGWNDPVRFYVAVPAPLALGPQCFASGMGDWDTVAFFPEGTAEYRRWVGKRFDPPCWEDESR